MATTRRKVSSGTSAAVAADVAASIIPNPEVEQAPAKERAHVEAPPYQTREPGEDDAGLGIGLGTRERAWGAIVEDVVRVDVERTYKRLRAELALGDNANAYGEIHQALDRAERNFFDAVLLSRAAKLEQERVDREVEGRLEILRTQGRKDVEAAKRAELDPKSKATGRATLQEVEDYVRSSWPDEFAARKRETEEMHAARAACEGLVTAWSSRAQTLRKLAERYIRNGG